MTKKSKDAGDVSLQGMGHLLRCPRVCPICHPCVRTVPSEQLTTASSRGIPARLAPTVSGTAKWHGANEISTLEIQAIRPGFGKTLGATTARRPTQACADPVEYEEEGFVYVEGTCLRCGSRVVSEIQDRDAR